MTTLAISTDGMRSYQIAKLNELVSDSAKRLLVLRYGTGKSWIALAANGHLYRATRHADRGGAKAIILCCLRNVDTWKREIAKRDPDATVASVTDKIKVNGRIDTDAWMRGSDYLLVPHHLVSKLWVKLDKYICVQAPFGLICDESTKIKNHKTARSAACLDLAKHHATYIPKGFRLSMTGNATPEGAHEIWSQLQFALPDKHALSTSYFGMLHFWFLATDRGPVLRAEQRKRFYEKVSRHVCRMTPEEWAAFRKDDKLRCTYTVETYEETQEQLDFQTSIFRDWELKGDGVVNEYVYAVQLHSKAQQIANGFWRDDSDTTHWLEDGCPKADRLIEIVKDLLEEGRNKGGRQIIVWCHYREDYELLGRLLLDAEIPFAVGPEADAITAFHTGKASVILMPVTVSEGFNELAVADVAIYYSNVYSMESRNQSEHRIIRLNQKAELVVFIDLCGTCLHDRRVIESLQSKQPIQPNMEA